jgi:hypothetical protein
MNLSVVVVVDNKKEEEIKKFLVEHN